MGGQAWSGALPFQVKNELNLLFNLRILVNLFSLFEAVLRFMTILT